MKNLDTTEKLHAPSPSSMRSSTRSVPTENSTSQQSSGTAQVKANDAACAKEVAQRYKARTNMLLKESYVNSDHRTQSSSMSQQHGTTPSESRRVGSTGNTHRETPSSNNNISNRDKMSPRKKQQRPKARRSTPKYRSPNTSGKHLATSNNRPKHASKPSDRQRIGAPKIDDTAQQIQINEDNTAAGDPSETLPPTEQGQTKPPKKSSSPKSVVQDRVSSFERGDHHTNPTKSRFSRKVPRVWNSSSKAKATNHSSRPVTAIKQELIHKARQNRLRRR